MKRIEDVEPLEYPDDCRAIRDQLERLGWLVDLDEAQMFWDWYSHSRAAGWLALGLSDEEMQWVWDDYLFARADYMESVRRDEGL